MTEGLNSIMGLVCRVLLGLLGGIAGYQVGTPLLKEILPHAFLSDFIATLISIFLFGFIGVLATPLFMYMLNSVGMVFEKKLSTTTWPELSSAIAGLTVGLLVANLVALPFADMPFGPYIAVLLNVLIGFVMAWIFVRRQGDIRGAMSSVRENMTSVREKLVLRRKNKPLSEKQPSAKTPAELESADRDGIISRKILDTSAIIDGRILDIAKTGFLQGTLILPSFVLAELQSVADSKDQGKRSRGRMGLDVVKELQSVPLVHLKIVESSVKELNRDTVDSAIVSMAQRYGGEILTTDYNLNKVAQIQNVRVLNVNDLANALKPTLFPGDVVTVNIIKEGKDSRQGIGYLENGTMLVVEDGGPYIGKTMDVTLSSMLQTSAGRMFFGRIKREARS